jgi:hypothetical protein
VIGLVGGLANSAGTGYRSVLAIMGVVCQYVAGRAFIKSFSDCDWLPSGNEYLLSTPASRHRKGRGASPTIYQRVNGSYETVICDKVENSDGFLPFAHLRLSMDVLFLNDRRRRIELDLSD